MEYLRNFITDVFLVFLSYVEIHGKVSLEKSGISTIYFRRYSDVKRSDFQIRKRRLFLKL